VHIARGELVEPRANALVLRQAQDERAYSWPDAPRSMNFAASQAIKQGLLATGHYRRALRRSRFPGVAVLGYHGLRGDDWPAGSMAFENLHVRASTFEAHCRVIRETCDPIALDDWRAALLGTAPLPQRPVLVTFDDGYRSVFTIGPPPICRRSSSPAPIRWNAAVCCGSTMSRRVRVKRRSSRGRRASTGRG
jgi:hypothetical protein